MRSATLVGFTGGVVAGLVVWSEQTHRYRRNLFNPLPLRRLAALGYLSGQRSARTVRLLRDYVEWERHPGLRRRGEMFHRRMQHSLE
jgi:hypothetical protein